MRSSRSHRRRWSGNVRSSVTPQPPPTGRSGQGTSDRGHGRSSSGGRLTGTRRLRRRGGVGPCSATRPPPQRIEGTPSTPPATPHLNTSPPPSPDPPCAIPVGWRVSLRGPGQSVTLACCVGALCSDGCRGPCAVWCRFRISGAQSLAHWGLCWWLWGLAVVAARSPSPSGRLHTPPPPSPGRLWNGGWTSPGGSREAVHSGAHCRRGRSVPPITRPSCGAPSQADRVREDRGAPHAGGGWGGGVDAPEQCTGGAEGVGGARSVCRPTDGSSNDSPIAFAMASCTTFPPTNAPPLRHRASQSFAPQLCPPPRPLPRACAWQQRCHREGAPPCARHGQGQHSGPRRRLRLYRTCVNAVHCPAFDARGCVGLHGGRGGREP